MTEESINGSRKFLSSLEAAGIDNIEFGFVENNLFGSDNILTDLNGVSNSKIDVFYFVKKAKTPNAPYLVFLNGGPGIAVTDMFLQYKYFEFLPELNVVFFDQRGNGLSHAPSGNVNELQYYSARYIVDDAEKIRQKLLGDNSKWIVFGQSFGGVIARKYIENAPNSIERVITHGSAKFDAVDAAVNTEIRTNNRLKNFFAKYPEDLKIIESVKSELTDSDSLYSKIFCLKGRGLIHILSILYSIKSDDDFHQMIVSFDSQNLKLAYLESIKPLSDLILNAGLVNQAVAQINLIGELTSEQISMKAKMILKSRNIDVDNSVISRMGFDDSLETISPDLKKLENLFKENKFRIDVVDLDRILNTTNDLNIRLDVFGGEADTLAIDNIRKEEAYFSELKPKNIYYHYSEGHHREWLSNSEIFREYLY